MATYKNKTETLKYHGSLSPDTIQKMKEVRKAFIVLSEQIEALGNSREVSVAFTHIETAQMYAIKHLCMADTGSVLEELA